MGQFDGLPDDNRDEVRRSEVCGRFYCLRLFGLTEVNDRCRRGRRAICPYRGVDAVIGSTAGKAITPEWPATLREDSFWRASARGGIRE